METVCKAVLAVTLLMVLANAGMCDVPLTPEWLPRDGRVAGTVLPND